MIVRVRVELEYRCEDRSVGRCAHGARHAGRDVEGDLLDVLRRPGLLEALVDDARRQLRPLDRADSTRIEAWEIRPTVGGAR